MHAMIFLQSGYMNHSKLKGFPKQRAVCTVDLGGAVAAAAAAVSAAFFFWVLYFLLAVSEGFAEAVIGLTPVIAKPLMSARCLKKASIKGIKQIQME